ncbi:MAG: hypothetical protein QGF67_19180, partial [Lentisphaeria bacterium]|nr:hypothetical protein [Lentisphaeria bacterium]
PGSSAASAGGASAGGGSAGASELSAGLFIVPGRSNVIRVGQQGSEMIDAGLRCKRLPESQVPGESGTIPA